MDNNILIADIVQVQERIVHYHQIFYCCQLIAILCSGGAAILFLIFEIPKVLGELTGITAKKKIKEFERKNASAVQYTQKKICRTTALQETKDSNETILLEEEFSTKRLKGFDSCHKDSISCKRNCTLL